MMRLLIKTTYRQACHIISMGISGSYHACHNATNGMMAGVWLAGYLVMPLPTLVAVLAIGGGDIWQ